MIDKSGFKLNRVISPETKYMYLMGAIQEAELSFLLARIEEIYGRIVIEDFK